MFYMFGFERPPPSLSSLSQILARTFLFVFVFSRLVFANTNILTTNSTTNLNLNISIANETATDYDDGGGSGSGGDGIDEDEDIDQVASSYDLFRLKRKLLFEYDRDSRPLYNSIEPMRVYFRVKLVQLNHLDEVYQVIYFTSFFVFVCL